MAFQAQMRKVKQPFPMWRNWVDIPGCSAKGTSVEAQLDIEEQLEYDRHYSLSGWEYTIKEVKDKSNAKQSV